MKVMIMVGASGAGKSTYVNKHVDTTGRALSLAELNTDEREYEFYDRDTVILSADDITFDEDGTFHIERLGSAHGLCVKTFAEILQLEEKERPPVLIVDNTNTSPWEIAPYVALAMAHGNVELEILVVSTPWEKCVMRNKHGTPNHAIRAQSRRLERMLDEWPPYWPQPKYAEFL